MFRFGDPGGRMYGSVGTNSTNFLALWTQIIAGSGSTPSVVAGAGRNGGSCLSIFSNTNSIFCSRTLDNQSIWGVALAYKPIAGINSGGVIAAFADVSTNQVDFRTNANGTISVTRNGAVLGTSTAFVTPTSWTHIELLTLINNTTGTVQLWMNSVLQFSLTGQNTRATANNYANVFSIGNYGTGTHYYDDIIVYDGQATDTNGFPDITGPIGDCGLAWQVTNGSGTTTQFTPDSGANYARVNEATPDGDTSYVESSTVGAIDTYADTDLPASAAAVKSIAAVYYARKTDVGSRGMKAVIRSGGGNAANATEIALSNSYQYYLSNFGQDPNNGSPQVWTPARVNALEFGQTVSS